MAIRPWWRFEMVRSLGSILLLAAVVVLVPGVGNAQHGNEPPKTPPGLAKKGGVPPGQAKRGRLPPGLAKKLGPHVPSRVYAAVDPQHTDRIWFLVDSRWVLRADLDLGAQKELKVELDLDVAAPPPPPVPPPKVGVQLTVMLFSD